MSNALQKTKITHSSVLPSSQEQYEKRKIGESGIPLRGCPSLVGGRPAKSVAGNGRVGSNPTPRALTLLAHFQQKNCQILPARAIFPFHLSAGAQFRLNEKRIK